MVQQHYVMVAAPAAAGCADGGGRRRVPPPPPYEDYEARLPPEEPQFCAQLLTFGRPPMIMDFGNRGRVRIRQMWHRVYESTDWQGYWRRSHDHDALDSLEVCFRYFAPSDIMPRITFVSTTSEYGEHYWKSDSAILTGVPPGLEDLIERGRRIVEGTVESEQDDR